MKKRLAIVTVAVALLAAGYTLGQYNGAGAAISRANPGNLGAVAKIVAEEFDTSRTKVKTLADLANYANAANVPLQYALVKQNDEIIRLLRKIAGETK